MIYKDKNKIEKGLFGWVSKIKDRMYRTITPRGYHIGQAAKEFIKGDTRDMSKFTPLENEVWARYLGTKYEGPSNLEPATYRPTKGGATYNDVVKLKDESLILSDNVLKLLLDNYKKTGKKSMLVKGNESGLGTYTISMGEDKNGKYISYYDDWDINPTRGISAKYNIPILNLIGDIVPGTHPFSVYGRRYYKNGGKMNAIEQFKEGHKIHIKKKNRGKFTSYCGGNVTSACIAKAKASGNPTLVKRATFALNSRKWKHLNGGILVTPEMEQNRYQGEITPGKGFTDKLKDVGRALGQFIPFIGTALDTEERQGYAAAVGSMKDIGIPAFTYTANNKLSNRTYRGWDRKRHRNKNYGKPYINSRLAKPLAKGLGIVGLILDTPNMVSDLENLKRVLGFNYNHQLLMKELKGGKLCLIPRN